MSVNNLSFEHFLRKGQVAEKQRVSIMFDVSGFKIVSFKCLYTLLVEDILNYSDFNHLRSL